MDDEPKVTCPQCGHTDTLDGFDACDPEEPSSDKVFCNQCNCHFEPVFQELEAIKQPSKKKCSNDKYPARDRSDPLDVQYGDIVENDEGVIAFVNHTYESVETTPEGSFPLPMMILSIKNSRGVIEEMYYSRLSPWWKKSKVTLEQWIGIAA